MYSPTNYSETNLIDVIRALSDGTGGANTTTNYYISNTDISNQLFTKNKTTTGNFKTTNFFYKQNNIYHDLSTMLSQYQYKFLTVTMGSNITSNITHINDYTIYYCTKSNLTSNNNISFNISNNYFTPTDISIHFLLVGGGGSGGNGWVGQTKNSGGGGGGGGGVYIFDYNLSNITSLTLTQCGLGGYNDDTNNHSLLNMQGRSNGNGAHGTQTTIKINTTQYVAYRGNQGLGYDGTDGTDNDGFGGRSNGYGNDNNVALNIGYAGETIHGGGGGGSSAEGNGHEPGNGTTWNYDDVTYGYGGGGGHGTGNGTYKLTYGSGGGGCGELNDYQAYPGNNGLFAFAIETKYLI